MIRDRRELQSRIRVFVGRRGRWLISDLQVGALVVLLLTHRFRWTPVNLLVGSLCATLALSANAVESQDLSFDTTEDLYQVCAAGSASPAQLACTGFIEATVQYHDGVANRKDMKRLICYPRGATIADGRKAFLVWAEDNKDDARLMAEQPVVGLVRALAKAFPCR